MQREYCSLRQIRINPMLYRQLKFYCKKNFITLTEFYNEMIVWFLKYIEANPKLTFQASYRNGKPVSLWIKRENIQRIREIAQLAKVSDARVISTALMLYVEHKCLLKFTVN